MRVSLHLVIPSASLDSQEGAAYPNWHIRTVMLMQSGMFAELAVKGSSRNNDLAKNELVISSIREKETNSYHLVGKVFSGSNHHSNNDRELNLPNDVDIPPIYRSPTKRTIRKLSKGHILWNACSCTVWRSEGLTWPPLRFERRTRKGGILVEKKWSGLDGRLKTVP